MVKAVAVLESNQGVSGTVFFSQNGNGSTTVTGNISGLRAGLHGFHVHALADTTNGCLSTGPHFNPEGKDHGAPNDENRHVGDLGNLVAGDDGTATFTIIDKQISLVGPNSVLGRAIVVHADPDDLARGRTVSLTNGNAGERIGCGKLPYDTNFHIAFDYALLSIRFERGDTHNMYQPLMFTYSNPHFFFLIEPQTSMLIIQVHIS